MALQLGLGPLARAPRPCLSQPGGPSSRLPPWPPRLVNEVEELNTSLAALKEKLLEAEQSLRNLEDTRMHLEKDLAVKTNSLFIDRQKCMAHRARYPTILQLAGYQ